MTIISAGIINEAEGPPIIDDFEDGDISEYSVYNPPNTGDGMEVIDESTVSFSAVNGSKMALFDAGEGDNPFYYSHPGDGLPNYFPKGKEVTLYFRKEVATRTDVSFCFGVEEGSDNTSGNNHYRATLQWDAFYGAVLENRNAGSTSAMVNNSNHDLNNGVWYEVVVRWDDGTLGGSDNDITMTVYEGIGGTEVMQLNANNSDHATADGVGWLPQQRDHPVYADYAHDTT